MTLALTLIPFAVLAGLGLARVTQINWSSVIHFLKGIVQCLWSN